MSDDEIRDFIAAHKWTFAKSMPKTPHEYTLRRNARDDAEFVAVVQEIRRRGEHRMFGRRNYIYLVLDGLEYWTMGYGIDQTILINRARTRDLRPESSQSRLFGDSPVDPAGGGPRTLGIYGHD
jgi:hypothetical protein